MLVPAIALDRERTSDVKAQSLESRQLTAFPNPTPERKKTPAKDFLRIGLVLLAFSSMGYILSLRSVQEEYLNLQRLRENLQDTGFRGMMAFIGLGGILTAVGVPRLWISALAGLLYGAILGTSMGLGASLLGATFGFLFARWVLRGPLKRRMPRRLVPWYERFNRNGFRYMLVMRLFPFSVAFLTNLLGGVSRISYPAFLAATTIGYLPLTIVFALFGKGATGQGYSQLLLGALLMAIVIVGERFLRRHLADELPDMAEESSNPSGDDVVNLEDEEYRREH